MDLMPKFLGISVFDQANAGAQVNWVGFQWGDVQRNLLLRIRGNQVPDVVQIQDRWLPSLARLPQMVDLNDVYGKAELEKLIDPGLDNYDPLSWIASNDIITSAEYPDAGKNLNVYPNPAEDFLTISAEFEIKSISLLDIYGRLAAFTKVNSESYELDVRQLIKGIYFLEIETSLKTYFRKIIVK